MTKVTRVINQTEVTYLTLNTQIIKVNLAIEVTQVAQLNDPIKVLLWLKQILLYLLKRPMSMLLDLYFRHIICPHVWSSDLFTTNV